ncbi:hypothetical protein L3Q67_24920 [Saccharothrix sp. AJ9571]|nr:hypothetical protein L3Q67_24920 [Saccharothrix sp. AJ9571]
MGRFDPLDDDYRQEFRVSRGRAVTLGLANLAVAAFVTAAFLRSPPAEQIGALVLLMFWGGAFHWLVLARRTRVDATGIRISRLSGSWTIPWPEVRDITEKPGQLMTRGGTRMRVAVVEDSHGYRYVLPQLHNDNVGIFDAELHTLRQTWLHRRGENWVDRPVPPRAVGKAAEVSLTVALGLCGAFAAVGVTLLVLPHLEDNARQMVSLLAFVLGGWGGSAVTRDLVDRRNHRTPVRARRSSGAAPPSAG